MPHLEFSSRISGTPTSTQQRKIESLRGQNPYQGLFGGFLEDDPRAAYFSQKDPFGTSPTQRKFYENAFSRIHNQFLGALGRQARTEHAPTLRFTDFLEGFPFQQELFQATPFQRGQTTRQFAPRTRFLPF